MKLFMIAFFICQFNCLVKGQTKISGIGPFKILATPSSIIDTLSKMYGVSIKETNDVLETETNYYDENPTKIFFISKDKNENAEYPHSKYIRHPKVKVYFLNNFLIPEVVVLHNVFLRFFNDTLYSFECEGSEILDTALTLKYGNPKIKIRTHPVTCSNAYRTFNYEEYSSHKEWQNLSKKIDADLVYSTYYNSKCEKKSFTYFLLYNTVIDTKITDYIDKGNKMKEAQNLNEKKKSLTNF